MTDTWRTSQADYIARNMPDRAMGGGVCENILARFHAIAVVNALAGGHRPDAAIVQEAHRTIGSELDYPAEIVAIYPGLKEAT